MSITYTDKTKSKGTQVLDDGSTYTGQFKDDKKHGKGILTSLNNRKYDGYWDNDVPHGPGIATFPNGKTYTGEYKHGRPFGPGTWTYKNGDTYSGVWEKGQFVNKQNLDEISEFRTVGFLINLIVVVFVASAVLFWLLAVLQII